MKDVHENYYFFACYPELNEVDFSLGSFRKDVKGRWVKILDQNLLRMDKIAQMSGQGS